MANNKVAQIITDRFIKELEKGIIPWQKPWHRVKGCAPSRLKQSYPCISYSTGKPYDIMNQMLLDFEEGQYITFKQCTENGGKVKKGAKSKMVIGWIITKENKTDENGNVITDENGDPETTTHIGLRYYNVFNLNDCEGIKPRNIKETPDDVEGEENETLQPDETATAIINSYLDREATLTYQADKPSDRAYYSPAEDKVVVPMLSQFDNVEEFYSTSFHELTHSTLKKSRCNREEDRKGKSVAFGSQEYSKEELVAEIGASTLVNICGLETEKSFRNSTAYVESWLSKLKSDPNFLIYACARADKAINYILGAE